MTSAIHELFQNLRTSLAQPRADLFSEALPVYVYGAGNIGREVQTLLAQRGVQVLGFLDRAARPGKLIDGLPVYAPSEDAGLDFSRIHVVLGLFNKYVEIPPVLQLLRGLGCAKVTSFLELHDHFAAELGNRFWLTARDFYLAAEPRAVSVSELWSDATSRELFTSILKFRFTLDHALVKGGNEAEQYFDPSLPKWKTPLRFIDCGAYTGDTLKQLIKTGIPLDAIAAFEPDQANFAKMSECVEANRAALPESVCLYPCGVDGSTRQLRFSSAQGSGSHFDASGDTVVQCVSLDQALHGFAPNLIKMDIEGAELPALWGAHKMIREARPGLAICLYHRPEHLWQIPALVRQWYGDGAKYFLRCYSNNGFELVFYAFPE